MGSPSKQTAKPKRLKLDAILKQRPANRRKAGAGVVFREVSAGTLYAATQRMLT